jgi:hypothetical protein
MTANNHNHNPTGRRTPMQPAEFPLAWHQALHQGIGEERAIAFESREGKAKSTAVRFRRFLATLRQSPGHPSAKFLTIPGREVQVSVRSSLLGWMVVVRVVALPDLASAIAEDIRAGG